MKVHNHIHMFWPLITNLIHKNLAYNPTLCLLEDIYSFLDYTTNGIIYCGP